MHTLEWQQRYRFSRHLSSVCKQLGWFVIGQTDTTATGFELSSRMIWCEFGASHCVWVWSVGYSTLLPCHWKPCQLHQLSLLLLKSFRHVTKRKTPAPQNRVMSLVICVAWDSPHWQATRRKLICICITCGILYFKLCFFKSSSASNSNLPSVLSKSKKTSCPFEGCWLWLEN